MACHTSLVLWGKTRKGLPYFVTCPALFMAGFCRIDSCSVVTNSGLIMWIMTLDTTGVFFGICYIFSAVQTIIQVVHDIIMTGQAFINAEKIGKVFVYMRGIGVEGLAGNAFVTVLAGCLTMNGDMKLA